MLEKDKEAIRAGRLRVKRALAACAGVCMIVSQLAPSVAVACEGGGEEGAPWLSIKNAGGPAKEEKGYTCVFKVATETCSIRFTNNLAAEELEIVKGELKGENSGLWWRVGTGCIAGNKLAAAGGNCADTVEIAGPEPKKSADYCLFVKKAGKESPFCAVLRSE